MRMRTFPSLSPSFSHCRFISTPLQSELSSFFLSHLRFGPSCSQSNSWSHIFPLFFHSVSSRSREMRRENRIVSPLQVHMCEIERERERVKANPFLPSSWSFHFAQLCRVREREEMRKRRLRPLLHIQTDRV